MRMRVKIRIFLGVAGLGFLWAIGRLTALLQLRPVAIDIMIGRIKSTGLFDRDYYLQHHPDVADAGLRPLRHYVTWGDREGRAPMAFFDPKYYRAHAPGRLKHVNALLHYAWVGRYLRISPSPWFDTGYYLAENKDVARSGADPLRHYMQWGGLEGRSPNPHFDGAFYLRSNPDVVEAGMNPLLHYLLAGRAEGRPLVPPGDPEVEGLDPAPRPVLPEADQWARVSPRRAVADATVDVIMPVYRGRVETLVCLYSALSAETAVSFELIVIDDASPEPELTSELRRLAAEGLFTLLENPRNLGFVATVNRGMALHRDRDVVLLNSDAEVYARWLDRLVGAARRDPRVATVTPLSNNATICSYPRFLHDNPYPLELPYRELDALAAETNSGVQLEAPTGVGFCMYIRRRCLDEVGLFDEEAFGKGYGEENDFCQRAIQHGWRNVIAADVFVRHWGGASFRGETAARIKAAMRQMDERHPGYQESVMKFIQLDSLAEARQRLDWARLVRLRRQRNVLIVNHNRGGGTERHVQEDCERLQQEGAGVFFMRPVAKDGGRIRIGSPLVRLAPNLTDLPLRAVETVAELLRELGISEVHTHSLVDYEPRSPTYVRELVEKIGARWEVNLHDYKVICPRINLADEHGMYCGEPGPEECNRCLAMRGSDFGVKDIRLWRSLHWRALEAADQVLVPDQDVARRLERYYPGLELTVSPHEDPDPVRPDIQTPRVDRPAPLHVVVIGAISKLKGFDVLLACARDAAVRRLPLRFTVLGYTMNDRQAQQAGVQVTGKYREDEALQRLQRLTPDIVWLPSVWPETYSYTLSIALQTKAPVAAFDIGAIAERLRRIGEDAWLMPMILAADASAVNDRFMAIVFHGARERGVDVP